MTVSAKQFAEIFNDTGKYPYLRDVASALDMPVRRVRSVAANYRMRHAAGEKGIPHVISRENKAGYLAPEAGAEHREILTKLPSKDEPIEDLLERMMKSNEKYAAYHKAKDTLDLRIHAKGPIGVVGIPDPHLNNRGTLLRRALHEATVIAETPGLYCVGIGDWLDNFIIGRLERERRKDVISHNDANRVQEHYVMIIIEKIIAAIGGNHNDWIEQLGGVDVLGKIFEEQGLGSIYHPDQVRVRLNLPNGKTFTHLARHKFPGKSEFHATHGVLKWALNRWQGEDVMWGGHIHCSGHMTLQRDVTGADGRKISKTCNVIQLPAYKDIDGYSIKEGFRENATFRAPLVIHDDETGKSQFFEDFDWGVETLKAMRLARGYK